MNQRKAKEIRRIVNKRFGTLESSKAKEAIKLFKQHYKETGEIYQPEGSHHVPDKNPNETNHQRHLKQRLIRKEARNVEA